MDAGTEHRGLARESIAQDRREPRRSEVHRREEHPTERPRARGGEQEILVVSRSEGVDEPYQSVTSGSLAGKPRPREKRTMTDIRRGR